MHQTVRRLQPAAAPKAARQRSATVLRRDMSLSIGSEQDADPLSVAPEGQVRAVQPFIYPTPVGFRWQV